MFVVEIVATLTTILFLRDLFTGGGNLAFSFQINLWLWFTVLFANFAEAVAEGRGKAQAASLRKTKTDTSAKLLEKGATNWREVAGDSAQAGRSGAGRSRRPDPQRRRCDRRRGLGERSGHHRRIRACHPRIRRRPLGGHRRHHVISDWIKVRITAAPGLDLPRPHDRAGGRRGAAEDAQRNRAQYSAGRHDHHLRLCRGHHSQLCRLCRRTHHACWCWWRCS